MVEGPVGRVFCRRPLLLLKEEARPWWRRAGGLAPRADPVFMFVLGGHVSRLLRVSSFIIRYMDTLSFHF